MHLEQQTEQQPNFRLDVPLHDLLTKSPAGCGPGLQTQWEASDISRPRVSSASRTAGANRCKLDGWVRPEKRKLDTGADLASRDAGLAVSIYPLAGLQRETFILAHRLPLYRVQSA